MPAVLPRSEANFGKISAKLRYGVNVLEVLATMYRVEL
jgi:hypothetical protein